MNALKLTDQQCIGQRLMVGFNGDQLDDVLKYNIEQLKVGGMILFARNIRSPDQIEDLCSAAQEYAAQCGQPPLFISIDQEGGAVSRLKPPFTQFQGNPHIQTVDQASEFACITAQELRQIGVNMNMAPVLDVVPADGESIMRARSFGSDPDWVAVLGTEMIRHFQERKIMAVAKHFPGIGRTVLDSHHELPDLEIDVDHLAQKDMVPFHAAIHVQVAGIMLSHIRYRRLDPRWPASLSATIAKELLRHQLQYDGLVLTDDLDMGAVAKHYDIPTIVQQCLLGQVDILLVCHPGPKIAATFDEIAKQIQRDAALARLQHRSIERIMRAKQHYLDTMTGVNISIDGCQPA